MRNVDLTAEKPVPDQLACVHAQQHVGQVQLSIDASLRASVIELLELFFFGRNFDVGASRIEQLLNLVFVKDGDKESIILDVLVFLLRQALGWLS